MKKLESLLIKHGIIQSESIDDSDNYDGGIIKANVHRVATELIDTLSPWVPVSEMLPTEADADKNGDVLCWHATRGIHAWPWDQVRARTFTHWMTPPAAPKNMTAEN